VFRTKGTKKTRFRTCGAARQDGVITDVVVDVDIAETASLLHVNRAAATGHARCEGQISDASRCEIPRCLIALCQPAGKVQALPQVIFHQHVLNEQVVYPATEVQSIAREAAGRDTPDSDVTDGWLRENVDPFLEVILCLSQACLGKLIICW